MSFLKNIITPTILNWCLALRPKINVNFQRLKAFLSSFPTLSYLFEEKERERERERERAKKTLTKSCAHLLEDEGHLGKLVVLMLLLLILLRIWKQDTSCAF
jgi:uncharacterized membrane protein YkgB